MPSGVIDHEYTGSEEEIEVMKKNRRYYDWGSCHLGDGALVVCRGTDYMQYQVNLLHRQKLPGAATCVVLTTDETDKRNLVCKSETRRTKPTNISKEGGYISWNYQ